MRKLKNDDCVLNGTRETSNLRDLLRGKRFLGAADKPRHRCSGWQKTLVTLFALLWPATTCLGASALLTPESRKALELQPGVVLIYVQFKATLSKWTVKTGFWGSGFLYRPDGYLITNGHVAQLANEKDPKAALQRYHYSVPQIKEAIEQETSQLLHRSLTDDEKGKLEAEINGAISEGQLQIQDMNLTVFLCNGASYSGEIKAYSDPIDENGKDIAIIKIDGRNLPTVELGNSDDVNVGDPVTVIGYPGAATSATLAGMFSERSALIPTVTSGRISAVNKTDYKGTPVLQSEATINHGNSGGPAFDASGKVLGVATYTLNKADGGVSGLNFFVPVNTALEFVRQAGALPERGHFDQIWREALNAYAGRHWYKAHELMGSVLEMMPNEPDATKLQLQAAQNMRDENLLAYWVDRIGLPSLGMLAGLAIAAVVLLAVLLAQKPKPAVVPTTTPLQRVTETPAQTVQTAVAKVEIENENFGTIYINNGPLSGNRFPIPKKGLLIGRDPSLCAVVLADDTVSKEHAWVVPLDNGVVVIDRSSVNGTFVNSTDTPRISKMLLKNNDRIFIGRKNPIEITYFGS